MLIVSKTVLGQNFDYKISPLSNESSITNNVVSSFYKDRKGFLWIGKMDGLYRYNGYDFEIFSNTFNSNTGLSNPWVTDLDGSGDYLIVGTKNGLNLLNKSNQTFSYIFPSDINSEFSNHITAIDANEGNSEFLMGTTNGLFKVTLQKDGTFYINRIGLEGFDSVFNAPEIDQILSVPGGSIIRSSKNLFYLASKDKEAKRLEVEVVSGRRIGDSNALYLTKMGQLLVFADGNTYFTNLDKAEPIQSLLKVQNISNIYDNWPKPERVNTFLEDVNGAIWIGTEGEGLYVYHKKTNSWQNYIYKINRENVLKNDFVRALYEDTSGLLFVGTDAGVNAINTQQKRFQVFDHINDKTTGETEIVNVHGILEDALGNLWVGARGKGLFVLGTDFVVTMASDVNSSFGHIRSIIQDAKGEIWIGTQDGIYILDANFEVTQKDLVNQFKGKRPSLLPGEHIYAIMEDPDGNKWVSTANGLFVYTAKGETKKLTNTSIGTSLDNKIVYSLLLDSSDRIWLGTLNGMIAYLDYKDYSTQISLYRNMGKPLDFKIIRITEEYKKFIENYETYSICEVGKGNILVGTNFGICSIDLSKKEITPYSSLSTTSDSLNLGTSYVYGLLYEELSNTLWASSNNGLFTYDFNDGDLQRYGVKDGLQSLEFNGNSVYKGKNGHLYFGGARGLNVYDSSVKWNKSDYSPNVVLTGLLVNGKRITVDDGSQILTKVVSHTSNIQLKANHNTVGLEFVSLHLPYSSNNLYKCKLIGVDRDWRYLGTKRSINYANLPEGEYEFQLMGSNNDGVWNKDILRFGMEVLPAWYVTWWMMLLWYVLGVGIVVSFVVIILKNRDNRNELRIKEMERVKLAEIYESKLMFFTNISHELRTPLSLILDPVFSLIQDRRYYAKHRELLDIVKNNVERLRRLIDQIMDFRKYEYGKMELQIVEGDMVDTVKSIYNSFVHLSKVKNIRFRVKLPKGSIMMFYDQDKVEKILYNILSNSFKSVTNKGKVQLTLGELSNKRKYLNSDKYKLICGEKFIVEPEHYVYLKIADNGVGILEEDIHEIFTRFYQSDSVNSGTGIGLYMVKQLTEMHNGSILLNSKRNEGSTFIVILPKNRDLYEVSKSSLSVSPNKERILEELPSISEAPLVLEGAKKHSLVIVEDNDELRMYLKHILKDYYNVYTANNGLEGIDLIKEEIPDLVVSDIVMPEISGLDLCRQLKENFETSHIPIILLTAKAFDQQVVEGINSGADVYLIKPFNKDVLLANINNLIQNREKLRLMFQNSTILEPSKVTVTSVDEKLLLNLKQAIEDNIQDQNLTLEMLATEIGVSRAQMFRKVKALTGLTPNNFIKSIRLKFAVQLLEEEKFQMAEIAYLSGFKEASYFSRCFKETYGCTPKEYTKNHKRN
ncbi:hybrid sensor histidine kinase/response regulator transcription factor [Arenibacter aquaticus]|nr:hybrid sensor histidine kinase/response regulator transcription factor [Arenibacter aquaticus]